MYYALCIALIVVSIAGMAGATWLFPFVAAIAARRRSGASLSSSDSSSSDSSSSDSAAVQASGRPLRIAVAVPIHNEEFILAKTLDSIREAGRHYTKSHTNVEVELLVGLDGCSDRSKQIALAAGARVVESAERGGKWRMLVSLAGAASQADWLIYADAGILWPPTLLTEAHRNFLDPKVIGVAPAYRNPGGGLVEETLWSLERNLKSLEARAGGPVSIHGATVAYRVSALDRALTLLEGRGCVAWLNDDVAIPLALRTLHPEGTLVYRDDIAVCDHPHTSDLPPAIEFRRRRRMVIGNLQWVLGILPFTLQRNLTVGVLAMRRVFRLAWAYWAFFGVAGTFGLVASLLTPDQLTTLAIAGCALLVLGWFLPITRRLLTSARASLSFPIYLLNPPPSVQGPQWR